MYYPGHTWLTIGDGRYGSDAYFLRQNGGDSTATSISDASLRIAAQEGYITKFRVENAEHIAAPDASYDFVLCKESFHHFRRPPIAFYEMLRVAEKALILIEPQETQSRIYDHIRRTVNGLIGRRATHLFEKEDGNFIYKLSVREVQKMMMSLNYHSIAFRRFNDFYHPALAESKRILGMGAMLTKSAILLLDLVSVLRFEGLRTCNDHGFQNSHLSRVEARTETKWFPDCLTPAKSAP